ncbi:hypothetical protein [Pseudolysinimonas sp.]|uniref:hypothetical protein n=1 Tax=Pseudolysinimonas sp. TaxID=2680009 RepID=UPI003F7F4ED2
MSLIAVLLGAYLLINGSWSNFASALLTHDGLLGFLFVTQLLFGLVVLLFGVLVAPVDGTRRAIAAIVVVVLVAIWAVLQPAYVLGAARIPIRSAFNIGFLFGAPFPVTLAAAASWLIIRRRPGVSYLLLIATVIIPIALNAVLLAAAPSVVSVIVTTVLTTIVGVGIAWGGPAIAGRRAEPIG